jgi:hypothetical protein
MLIIEKDFNSRGNLYTVRAKEEGFGRGWKVKGLMLEEVQLSIAHYYGAGHGATSVPGCGLCRHFDDVLANKR